MGQAAGGQTPVPALSYLPPMLVTSGSAITQDTGTLLTEVSGCLLCLERPVREQGLALLRQGLGLLCASVSLSSKWHNYTWKLLMN